MKSTRQQERQAFIRIARRMLRRFRQCRAKRDPCWREQPPIALVNGLHWAVDDLRSAVVEGAAPDLVLTKAADVANYAAMIADRSTIREAP